jgi:hypothetical protein
MVIFARSDNVKRLLAVVLAVAVVASVVVWLLATPGKDNSPARSAPPSAEPTTPSPTPRAVGSACPTRAARAFAPRTISVPGITGPTSVISPPRDAAGIPGIPPLSSAGKTVFAWDREQGISPGDRRGNVLLNAHTWPDGSALGNRLLESLDRGDRIRVQGARSQLCYRVTERVEVLAEDGLPRFYAKTGRPQLAIVVCSGRRLGPGVWEKRTIWFASPRA